MSTAFNVKIDITRDGGKSVEGFPFNRRIVVDEVQAFKYEKANDGDAVTFTTIPVDQLSEIQLLVLRSDKQIALRLDAQTDAGIILNANGLILILNADIDAGASTNAKINNNSNETASVQGVVGGT